MVLIVRRDWRMDKNGKDRGEDHQDREPMISIR